MHQLKIAKIKCEIYSLKGDKNMCHNEKVNMDSP